MPRVTIEGMGTIVFPDDMTPEEIQSVIEQEILPQWIPSQEPSPPSPTQASTSESNQSAEPAPASLDITPIRGGDLPQWQSLLDNINELLARLESIAMSREPQPEPGSRPISESSRQDGWTPTSARPESAEEASAQEATPAASPVIEPPALDLDDLFATAGIEETPASISPAEPETTPAAEPEPQVTREDSAPGDNTYVAVATRILFPPANSSPANFPFWHIGPDEYLERRLQRQIDWYEARGALCQRRFKLLRSVEILAASAIPFLSGYSSVIPYGNLLIGSLSLAVAVAAGLLSLHQYQELWVQYRSMGEALKREKFLFLTGAGPYRGEDAFPALVQQVEDRLAHEQMAWGGSLKGLEKQGDAEI